jgi:DNA repair exonuclease SbcCD ATPase subunit
MTLKKIGLTFLLISCFITSAWASSTDSLSEKDKILSAKLTMAKDAMKVQHDKWWNDFEDSKFRKAGNIAAYMNQLADKDPEAAAWFLAGAKYGFVNQECTPDELENLRSTKKKVIEAEIKSIQNGAAGFLNNVKVSFETGNLVIDDLLKRVEGLEKNNKNLNADILNLKEDNKILKVEILGLKEKNESLLNLLKAADEKTENLRKSIPDLIKAAQEEAEKKAKERWDAAQKDAKEREERFLQFQKSEKEAADALVRQIQLQTQERENAALERENNWKQQAQEAEKRALDAEKKSIEKERDALLKKVKRVKKKKQEAIRNLDVFQAKFNTSEKALTEKQKVILEKERIISELTQKIKDLSERISWFEAHQTLNFSFGGDNLSDLASRH